MKEKWIIFALLLSVANIVFCSSAQKPPTPKSEDPVASFGNGMPKLTQEEEEAQRLEALAERKKIISKLPKNFNKGKLGGGYKDLKWGMSEEEVVKINAEVCVERGMFRKPCAGKLGVSFHEDLLYKISLTPTDSLNDMLTLFKKKFGQPASFDQKINNCLHKPPAECMVTNAVWSDKTTRITLEDTRGNNGYGENVCTNADFVQGLKCGTSITFTSLPIENMVQQEKAQAEKEAEAEKLKALEQKY